MMHKLLLVWAVLAIAVQGLRVHSESFAEQEQTEQDGQVPPAVSPLGRGLWQTLVGFLWVFNPRYRSTRVPFAPSIGLTGYAVGQGTAFNRTISIHPPTMMVLEDGQVLPDGATYENRSWQQVSTDVNFNKLVDTLSAASLVIPTGEPPGERLADGIVGTSDMLAALDIWFQENPEGIMALPLGADNFSGEQGMKTMSPLTVPLSLDVSLERRTIMNLMLVGSTAVPVGWLSEGFDDAYFFVPAGGSGAGSGLVAVSGPQLAKDALGDDVLFDKWLSSHKKGDAQYLIVTADRKIENYAINAVHTSHGSQYDIAGKVIRGPAPLSLALAHVDNVDNKVTLTPWTEQDLRPHWWT